jgi:glycosyltransferase involved in cell wall biosynthesis
MAEPERATTVGRILVIAHSAYGRDRAHQLLGGRLSARIMFAGGGWQGARRAAGAALRSPARTYYLIDLGVSTTAAAVSATLRGRRVIIDTGDLAFELARLTGSRGRFGLLAVWLGERLALRCASTVVVRGRLHKQYLPAKRTLFVPDLPPPSAHPVDRDGVRRDLRLEDRFVVGLVGSLVWAPRLGRCYGWDVIEALPNTSEDVVALIVGDGSGRKWLESHAHELGVADRCRFVGAQPSDRVSGFIAAMDVATSTQTNDRVGQVRTTGKLPLYLACGRPVIASHVGEAACLLGPLGWTVPYEGTTDPRYPLRVARKLNAWPRDPNSAAEQRAAALRLARQWFDTDKWATKITDLLSEDAN